LKLITRLESAIDEDEDEGEGEVENESRPAKAPISTHT
jgi:hypothetical protein